MTCKIKVLDGLQMEDVTGTTIYVVENSRRAHGWFGIPPNMSPARLWRHETTERDAVEFSSQVKYVAKLYEPGEHEEAAEDEDSTLRRSSVATAIAPYRHSLPSVPRPRTRRLQRESRHPVLCARCVEWRRRRQGEGGGGLAGKRGGGGKGESVAWPPIPEYSHSVSAHYASRAWAHGSSH
jgi:hypothetical protein